MNVVALLLLTACSGPSGPAPELPSATDVEGEIPVFSKDISGSDRAAFCKNLEQHGFDVFSIGAVGKNELGELEVGWNCSSKQDSLELQVEVYSRKGATAFHSLRATIRAIGGAETAKDGSAFFASIASLQYAGNDSAQAKQWVSDSFDTSGSKVIIGSAVFRIWAPSARTRSLWIDGV